MRSPHRLRIASTTVTAYIGFGLLWGCALRWWMRLISTDPEFTWSGTLFIVGLCTTSCALSGACRAATLAGTRRWMRVVLQVLAVVSSTMLGMGPGVLLLPALVGGGLARAFVSPSTPRRLAVLVGVTASVAVTTLVGEGPGGARQLLAAAVLALLLVPMTSIYATTYRPGRTTTRRSPVLPPFVRFRTIIQLKG